MNPIQIAADTEDTRQGLPSAILDALPGEVALVDSDGVIVAVNDAWRRAAQAGDPERASVGQHYEGASRRVSGDGSSDEMAARVADLRRVLNGELSAFAIEYASPSSSAERWTRMTATPLRHAAFAGALVVHLDITEQKQTEAALERAERAAHDSERRLGFALEAAGIGDWDMDLRTNVARRSARHDECFGYPHAVAEWGYDTFLAHVQPGDRDRVDACFKRAMAGDGEYDVEFRVNWPDGTEHWLWSRGRFYFDDAGTPVRVAGIQADITERRVVEDSLRASERRFAGAFEHAPIGVAMVAPDGRFLKVNSALCNLVGYSADEMLTRTFRDITHPDDLESSAGTLRDLLAGSVRTFQVEKRYVHALGHSVTALLNVSLVRDGDGQPQYQIAQVQDITERKQAEKTIARALERLTEAQAIGQMGDWEWDIASSTITWSPQVFEIVGRDPAEGAPTSLEAQQTYFTPASWALLQERVSLALTTGEPQAYELVVVRRTGERAHVQALAIPRTDATGKVTGLYGTVQDITARRATALQLTESEQRLALATESARIGIWEWDVMANKTTWDAQMCSLYGIELKKFGGVYDAWRSGVHPDDRRLTDAAIADALAGREDFHLEFRVVWPTGEVRHMEGHALVQRGSDDSPLRMVGVNWDITERKRNEARFRRLVDSNAQGVLFWRANGEITEANDAFLRLTGYTRDDMTAGRVDWSAITPPEYARLDRRSMEEIAATGVCTPYEKEFVRKNGSRVPVLVGATAFEDNPEEGICFAVDLTERKKLELQFLRAQRMESIGTLAGGIAHDLNNALAPIIMSLELLRLQFTDRESQELIDIIGSSAHHGAEMVRQVLSFARGVEGQRVEVQLRDLVREVEKISRDTFSKSIRVHADLPGDLWTVMGDPTQLHQVLVNLCVNARDALSRGGTLTISAENFNADAHFAALELEAEPGPYVLITVEDTGSGMAPGVIDRIFDPFFTTKKVGQGTGLGLATSLAIVKSHHGFIRVSSERDTGTRFRVYLPACTDALPVIAAPHEAEVTHGRGELVLVIDDERSVRQITRQTLETFGYQVVVASDGAEAVSIFARRHSEISVVLTDMMMPVMDGPATIAVLRRLDPAVRIICASGLTASGELASDVSMGVCAFLAKPYTATTLLKAVAEALQR